MVKVRCFSVLLCYLGLLEGCGKLVWIITNVWVCFRSVFGEFFFPAVKSSDSCYWQRLSPAVKYETVELPLSGYLFSRKSSG